MDFGLRQRTALVTGSTAGIGEAIARALAAEGAIVLINGRSSESVDRALERLGSSGRFEACPGDVGGSDGAASLLERLQGRPIDILVNNAGIFEPKPIFEIPDEDWLRFFEVNVLSGVRLSRALAPAMRDRGWGRIVFISSESALNIPVEMIHYGTTKTAQLAVARGLAKALAGTGVTVNSVLPGPTWTAGVSTFIGKMAADAGVSVDEMKREFFRRNRPSSLLERFADPDEVAAMVAYVCSERASATTGAALRVDGGLVDTIV